MLGLTFSSKLDWSSYIIFIAKTSSKKIGVLVHSMKFLFPAVAPNLIHHTTLVLGELPRGKFPFAKFSRGKFPLVKLPRGEFRRGIFPRGKLPRGKLPRIYKCILYTPFIKKMKRVLVIALNLVLHISIFCTFKFFASLCFVNLFKLWICWKSCKDWLGKFVYEPCRITSIYFLK